MDPELATPDNSSASPVNNLKQPYFVYTGSAYPHKNIPVIFQALQKLKNIHLYIISSRSVFLDQIKKQAQTQKVINQVTFIYKASDAQLKAFYAQATALIIPSRSEGFGLTGIEAMQLNLPVISSDQAALPEIYGPAALYFHPDDSSQLTHHIKSLLDNHHARQQLIEKGHAQAQKYSWDQVARQTLTIYNHILESK